MPGVSRGTRNIDIRRCGAASGSVTAMTIRNAAPSALEVKNFSPLITQPSPSCSARQVNPVGSAPPCGSVIENAEKISPFSSGSR